tara:strand:+ start:1922 stop:2302 length:381 start_codon:yes stop_codon:yes gene_type:complete
MSVPEGYEFNVAYDLDHNEHYYDTERNIDPFRIAQERKETPVYTGVLKYFPDAIKEISRVSLKGNQQHHPDEPLHWDRKKSTDELDALARHLIDAGTLDTDGIRHSAKVAWRALANLQKELENEDE